MIREVVFIEKIHFNRLALHPLQSWEWGEFRKKTGVEVHRLGRFEENLLKETAQITIHPLPFTNFTIGYLPKGAIPSEEMLKALIETGKKYRCIFIKLEPNVTHTPNHPNFPHRPNFPITPSLHPLFTKYTFQLDITKSEEELLSAMHHKTRYNIKVARTHKVVVKEDNSSQAFERYLELTFETTKRQKFFAHDRRYHTLMWETLQPSGIAHLLTATYRPQNHPGGGRMDSPGVKETGATKILVAWIVFLFNDILYYPYGASSNEHRNVMASNLMMWEAIRFGKKHNAKLFDMWGALGPDPNPHDHWYGFHKFKQGYGPKLVEFIGSYDLVIEPNLYRIYNLIHKGRELYLQLKSQLG